MAQLVVEGLEEVAVAHQQAERAPAALRARELVVDDALKATTVEQPGQRVGAGGVGELVDQSPHALAQRDEEHAGHRERPGHEDEGRHVLVRVEASGGEAEKPRADDDPRVVDDREEAQHGGLAPGQEVEGVQRDPQIEQQVGAGAAAREHDRQRRERGGAERADGGHPSGRAVADDQQQAGGGQRRALNRQQPDLVEALGVGEQHAQCADESGRGEQGGLGPRRHPGRQCSDGKSGFLPGGPFEAHPFGIGLAPTPRDGDPVAPTPR